MTEGRTTISPELARKQGWTQDSAGAWHPDRLGPRPAGYDEASPVTRRAWQHAAAAQADKTEARAVAPQRPANYDTMSAIEKRMIQLAEQRKAAK